MKSRLFFATNFSTISRYSYEKFFLCPINLSRDNTRQLIPECNLIDMFLSGQDVVSVMSYLVQIHDIAPDLTLNFITNITEPTIYNVLVTVRFNFRDL